jgi:very-short-patch-repair endonuclease
MTTKPKPMPDPADGPLFAWAAARGPGIRKVGPESPLEQRLRDAFLASSCFTPVKAQSDLVIAHGPFGLLFQQLPVLQGRYRLDFAIMSVAADVYIAIEVDGHAHHDRTREQARRDRDRDRALTAAGWTVLRFAGSEVWANARGCVKEVIKMLLPEKAQGARA